MISAATYTEDRIHGPEVDFGTGWRLRQSGPQNVRVTWVSAYDPEDRGDVIAFGLNEQRCLATNIPLFVVEHLLSKPEYPGEGDTGWATAASRGYTIGWVEARLMGWDNCSVVHYKGQFHDGGLIKAAKEYASKNRYEGRNGGWVYNLRTGRPHSQGWFTFGTSIRRAERMECVSQKITPAVFENSRLVTHSVYEETWIAKVRKEGN